MNPQSAVVVALIPFILWRVYSRIRRLIGRQQVKPVRHWIGAILFSLLLSMMFVMVLALPTALASLCTGVAIGVGLSVIGLRMTRFEKTNEGMFYTPNAHIGIALSLLFIGRLLYRMADIILNGGPGQRGADFAAQPLTMFIMGITFAYYAAYAVGILRWRRG